MHVEAQPAVQLVYSSIPVITAVMMVGSLVKMCSIQNVIPFEIGNQNYE
jgi:hypothetical protein